MHDHSPPTRLHSEHALSLTYNDWLALKSHEHLLASRHHRQQTLRNTVLTLFRQYQADTAYLCWWDEKRRQGWWDGVVEEEKEDGVDASAYHLRVGSEAFQQTSTPEFLRWATDKRRQEREDTRKQREQQQQKQRHDEQAAKEQHERARTEYSKWHTTKTQQLLHRRTQQHSQRAAQQLTTQQSKAEQQVKANQLYQQWHTRKARQQQRHDQRVQRQQQRREAQKKERQQQFEVLYPQAIAQYVATVEKWRKDEQAARQRQVKRERIKAGQGGGSAKKGVAEAQRDAAAAWRPASPMEVQRASSARLAAGKRLEGIKLPFAASTASTTAMSASVASAPSLFDSFSSSSSSSLSAASVPSATIAVSTARSTASEPVRRMRNTTHKRKAASRPAWNDDTTITVST